MYLSNDVKEKAYKLINSIFSYGFNEVVIGNLSIYQWLDKNSLFDDIYVETGETKLCIIDEEIPDWVCKVSYKERGDDSIDYCEIEERNYNFACKENVDRYFAPIFKLGEFEGNKVFIQERASLNYEEYDESFRTYVEHKSNPKDFEDEDQYWDYIWDTAEDMDEEEKIHAIFKDIDLNDLIDFVKKHKINDLHAGNWGTLDDGRIVIIDYSGY